MSLRASGASRSESNKMIAGGNHTLILRTLAWQSCEISEIYGDCHGRFAPSQ